MGTGLSIGTQGTNNYFVFDGGIVFHKIEVVNVELGSGNDTFAVHYTTPDSIDVIQGGGGNDTITVDGASSTSTLLLFGDTTQDGEYYDLSTTGLSTGHAESGRQFFNPGNDFIDASASPIGVIIDGGARQRPAVRQRPGRPDHRRLGRRPDLRPGWRRSALRRRRLQRRPHLPAYPRPAGADRCLRSLAAGRRPRVTCSRPGTTRSTVAWATTSSSATPVC